MRMAMPALGRRGPLGIEDYLVLSAVLLLPWAFGGVEIWAFRGAALLLVAGAGASLWKRGWQGWGLDRRAGWLHRGSGRHFSVLVHGCLPFSLVRGI